MRVFWLLIVLAGGLFAGELRVVSYNIKHGQGMDGEVDLERTAAVLKKLKPDFVALQEVDKMATRSGKVDQAAELGRMLGMHHAFGKFMDFQGGEYGLAVLSRFPVLDTHEHKLPDGAEPRVVLEVVTQPDATGPNLSVASIHLDWTKEELRMAQIKALEKRLSPRKDPFVLVGDFNAKPGSPTMEFVGRTWTVVPKTGERSTFSAAEPRIEIDYVVTRGIGKGATCRVVAEAVASDHRPLLSVIPWP
jgi:endonuclease/exonuclease/phosphatase family metal-dependent hydrolase